jgi:hypothetical protein
METNSREVLRRAVRRAVHRACWRRLEGDTESTHTERTVDLAQVRAENAGAVAEVEMQSWIAEDEAEFDRAMLISDLVARRVQRSAAPAPIPALVPAGIVEPEREIIARPSGRASPSITDLLDDMFSQQQALAAAATR